MRRPSRETAFLGVLFLGAMAISFQNCGVGFQPGSSTDGSLEISGASRRITMSSGSSGLMAGMVSVGKGAIFRMSVDSSRLPSGARLLWESIYSDGMSYCEQTTSIDRMTADFQCLYDGLVTITMNVYVEGVEEPEVDTMTVVVGLPSSVPIGPIGGGPGSGGATPTPTPVAMTPGETLYLNNCRDCHGDLNSSTKRGTTRVRLDSAITGVAAMRNLSFLTPQERDQIVQALQR